MTRQRLRLLLGSLGGLLLAGFVGLGVWVTADGPTTVDSAVAAGLADEYREPLGTVATVLSAILGPVLPVLLGVGLLVAAGLAQRRGLRPRAVLLLKVTAVLALTRLTSFVGKPLFDRDRPRPYPDFSYPSGHVVSVAATAVAVLLLAHALSPHRLGRIAAACAAAVLLIAACRVVLTVHWVTDTVGAVLAVGGVGLLAALALGLLPARAPGVASVG